MIVAGSVIGSGAILRLWEKMMPEKFVVLSIRHFLFDVSAESQVR